ncbi:MFS transporter [Streptomyces sparsogenes]|uniref:MFS transporter n=1 Tax=Streptomyces sparsogenes TaxID=67365 RepID=UPI0033FA7874
MNTTDEPPDRPGKRSGKRWGVLAQRDFRLLWTGETVSGLGNSITAVALPLIAVEELDADSTAVGLLAAAVWLPWLLIGLPVGAWVDRIRKRPLMIACDLVSVVALASIPPAAWFDALTLPHLVVAALLCGAAAVCFNTAYHSYIRIVLDGRDLLEGNAKLQGSAAATRVARRFGTARGLLFLQAVTTPFALLLPMTTAGPGLPLFAVGGFLVGLGISVANVVVGSFRQAYCPPRMLGRVVATAMMINHSTIPLGSLLGGLLGDAVGYRPAMWTMTGLVAPSWLILAMSPMRRERELPRAYEPEPAAAES